MNRPGRFPSLTSWRNSWTFLVCLAFTCLTPPTLWAARGELELTVRASGSEETLVAQLQLRNAKGRIVRAPGLPSDGDWQLIDGKEILTLPPGAYSFRIRRGLEYRERTGQFVLKSGDADHQQVELPRFVSMSEEGWWSGDLEVYPKGPAAQLATRILASDVHLVSPVRWANPQVKPPLPKAIWQFPLPQLPPSTGRSINGGAAIDRRRGSVTLLLGGSPPQDLPAPTWETHAYLQWLASTRSPQTSLNSAADPSITPPSPSGPHVHLTSVTHWDLPLLVAQGLLDSVGLLSAQITEPSTRVDSQHRPHDPVLFPEPTGAAQWALRIYFHLLNTGHRVPPGAGSGSGLSLNPLGFHRLYVQCGDAPWNPTDWWKGLREGRVVVTNGPLLRPRVNEQWPGYQFRAKRGEKLELQCELNLATQDKIHYLEIVQNGRPVQHVRLEEWKARRGQLDPLVATESGWVMIVAVADHPTTFRSAVSGPFYVEFDDQPRISRESAQFFLDWLEARSEKFGQDEATASATAYWQSLLERANVD